MIKINESECILYDITTTPSGLGDRLLDIITGLSISKILDIKYICLWANVNSLRECWKYDKNLLNIENSILINDDESINIEKSLKLEWSLWKVIKNYTAATASPSIIKDKIYILFDKYYEHQKLIEIYKTSANKIKPSDDILKLLKSNLNEYIGIHIRITDKLTENKDCTYEMTLEDCKKIIHKVQIYILDQIEKGNRKYFIATDNYDNGKMFKNWIESNNAECIINEKITSSYNGINDILDLFSLSECQKIIQVTKYSTFSIVASLLKNKKLINFYGRNNNLLSQWEEILNLEYI